MNLQLTYNILGGEKGDTLVQTYKKLSSTDFSLEHINKVLSSLLLELFKNEIKKYCVWKNKIENFVVKEILNEVQTYISNKK